MLVHGFASRAEHNWGATQWFTTLAPHYRVVALDCRGHGKSGKPHDPAAYGGKTMGDDVIRLIDHLGIKRTLIMGYSMGGRIVTGLLMSHPERLRAAVLGGIGAVSATAPSFSRKPIVDALLAENASGVTDERAKEFRQFAESAGNDLKALAACMGAKSRGPYRRADCGEENSRTGHDRYRHQRSASRQSHAAARFDSGQQARDARRTRPSERSGR